MPKLVLWLWKCVLSCPQPAFWSEDIAWSLFQLSVPQGLTILTAYCSDSLNNIENKFLEQYIKWVETFFPETSSKAPRLHFSPPVRFPVWLLNKWLNMGQHLIFWTMALQTSNTVRCFSGMWKYACSKAIYWMFTVTKTSQTKKTVKLPLLAKSVAVGPPRERGEDMEDDLLKAS